jgi:hypothetical protein
MEIVLALFPIQTAKQKPLMAFAKLVRMVFSLKTEDALK